MTVAKGAALSAVFRWAGRGLAFLMILFWGAFFVEHLSEWFLAPHGGPPPLRVWVAQALHLVMLVGLGLMLRWDRLGTIVTVSGTTAFFAVIGFHGFPFLALLNLPPIICFALAHIVGRR